MCIHTRTHAICCYCLRAAVTQGVPCTAIIADLLCYAIWVLIVSGFTHQSSLAVTGRHQVAKPEVTWPEMYVTVAKCPIFILTDSFTSPLKEAVLQTSVAVRNPSSSSVFEPANLGSSGKYDNEADYIHTAHARARTHTHTHTHTVTSRQFSLQTYKILCPSLGWFHSQPNNFHKYRCRQFSASSIWLEACSALELNWNVNTSR
jgi:hypothetical protein